MDEGNRVNPARPDYNRPVKLYTIEHIPGAQLEVLGLVQGSVVQSKNTGRDPMAGFKTLIGGEIVGYTEMLNEARTIPRRAWPGRPRRWAPMP